MEVPTEPAYVEQIVDNPVPHTRRRRPPRGLQGSPPRQRTVEQTVDIPVPFGHGRPLHGFRPGQVPTASLLPEPDVKCTVPAPWVILPPVPVLEYFSPAPAVLSSPEPVVEYSSSVPAEFQARSSFHPYLWSPNRQCQWWRTLHPRQQCFLLHSLTDKFQQLDVELRVQQLDVELMSVVEVVRALSQDRVQQLVVGPIIASGGLFILPDSRGCGFIESSAEAEFGESASGGFRVPVSWQEHFAVDSTVTFSVRKGPTGFI